MFHFTEFKDEEPTLKDVDPGPALAPLVGKTFLRDTLNWGEARMQVTSIQQGLSPPVPLVHEDDDTACVLNRAVDVMGTVREGWVAAREDWTDMEAFESKLKAMEPVVVQFETCRAVDEHVTWATAAHIPMTCSAVKHVPKSERTRWHTQAAACDLKALERTQAQLKALDRRRDEFPAPAHRVPFVAQGGRARYGSVKWMPGEYVGAMNNADRLHRSNAKTWWDARTEAWAERNRVSFPKPDYHARVTWKATTPGGCTVLVRGAMFPCFWIRADPSWSDPRVNAMVRRALAKAGGTTAEYVQMELERKKNAMSFVPDDNDPSAHAQLLYARVKFCSFACRDRAARSIKKWGSLKIKRGSPRDWVWDALMKRGGGEEHMQTAFRAFVERDEAAQEELMAWADVHDGGWGENEDVPWIATEVVEDVLTSEREAMDFYRVPFRRAVRLRRYKYMRTTQCDHVVTNAQFFLVVGRGGVDLWNSDMTDVGVDALGFTPREIKAWGEEECRRRGPTFPQLGMSFDIEAGSHSDYTFCNAEQPHHRVTSVSTSWWWQDALPPRLRDWVAEDEEQRSGVKPGAKIYRLVHSLGTSHRVEECPIIEYGSEASLLSGLRDHVVVAMGADIITGWNIFGFDNRYLWKRAVLGSRFQWNGWYTGERGVDVFKDMSSAAKGRCEFFMIWHARARIDGMIWDRDNVKRDLGSSLRNVAREVLGDDKDPIKPHHINIHHAFLHPAAAQKIHKYCMKDSDLVTDLAAKLQYVKQSTEESAIMYTSVEVLATSGQGIKVFNTLVYFAHADNFLMNGAKTTTYATVRDHEFKGGTNITPQPILYQMDPETKKGCSACFDFASLYPTIMMAFNVCTSTIVEDKDVARLRRAGVPMIRLNIPGTLPEDPHTEKWCVQYYHNWVKASAKDTLKILEGPQAEWYDVPAAVIHGHIVPATTPEDAESVLKSMRARQDDNAPVFAYRRKVRSMLRRKLDVEGDVRNCDTFAQQEKALRGSEGLMPQVERLMFAMRRAVKREMNTHPKGSIEYMALNCRQKALKVVMNSLFGVTGAQRGWWCFKYVAAGITWLGGQCLRACVEYLEHPDRQTVNGRTQVIYGDTDSVYPWFFERSPVEMMESFGKPIEHAMTAMFPPPIEMEMESLVVGLLGLKSKMYMMLKTEAKWSVMRAAAEAYVANPRDRSCGMKTEYKGMVMVKRDCPKSVRVAAKDVGKTLFFDGPIAGLQTLHEALHRWVERSIPLEDWAFTKRVKACADYDKGSNVQDWMPIVWAAYRASPGSEPKPSDRVTMVRATDPDPRRLNPPQDMSGMPPDAVHHFNLGRKKDGKWPNSAYLYSVDEVRSSKGRIVVDARHILESRLADAVRRLYPGMEAAVNQVLARAVRDINAWNAVTKAQVAQEHGHKHANAASILALQKQAYSRDGILDKKEEEQSTPVPSASKYDDDEETLNMIPEQWHHALTKAHEEIRAKRREYHFDTPKAHEDWKRQLKAMTTNRSPIRKEMKWNPKTGKTDIIVRDHRFMMKETTIKLQRREREQWLKANKQLVHGTQQNKNTKKQNTAVSIPSIGFKQTSMQSFFKAAKK
jgi:DNA polymerase elongation subunit (family B)